MQYYAQAKIFNVYIYFINMKKKDSMHFTTEQYQKIKNKYGKMASWAIWKEWNTYDKSKAGMGDISFFENPTPELLESLKPNIVLVALNLSKEINRSFSNFHPNYSTAHDYKIRYALHGTPLWGAYMTDMIKDFEEKISGNVRTFLLENPSFVQQNIDFLKQELVDMGASNPIVIAFGRDTYRILRKHLKGEFNIFKVTHYSHRISKEKLREEFQLLLSQLQNKRLIL